MQSKPQKKLTDSLLTIYGRKPVLEALSNPQLKIFRLHLADTNQNSKIIEEIMELAQRRKVEYVYHDRKSLAYISKNGNQDQGVALDIVPEHFGHFQHFLDQHGPLPFQLIAVDGITNPQNLGMIIRSVGASPMTGLIIPRKGCAKVNPLVIKASAGTLFKTRILRCDSLADCLAVFSKQGVEIVGLDTSASVSIDQFNPRQSVIYVLGNETEGLTKEVQRQCHHNISIPMANGVESLNVAITASLIAFRSVI